MRNAFAAKGHSAFSVDSEPSATPGEHYQADIRSVDYSGVDIVIAFPPCTHLAVSGARYFGQKLFEQTAALELVKWILQLPIEKIALENPVGVISTFIRKPDQIIQPWQFGHDASKKTCLWLKNLPELQPTQVIKKARYSNQTPSGQNNLPPSADRARIRGLTYSGVAEAMADQWGSE